LDEWFEREVKPRLTGPAFLVRYVDDAVIAFASEKDAQRVMDVLPKRFGKYGLTLHPKKTRLVQFRRPALERGGSGGSGGAAAFDLLGFTHHWAASKKGNWVIKQKTAENRFQRALKRITEWCKEHRHMPVRKQQHALAQKLNGHYGY